MLPGAARKLLNDRATRARLCAAAALAFSLVACQRPSQPAQRRSSSAAVVSISVHAPAASGPHDALDVALLACRKRAQLPCDVRKDTCQQGLFELVQCLRGTRDGVRPPLRVVSEAVSRRRTRENRGEKGRGQAPLAYAVKRLGLGGEELEPRGDGVGPNAYYAPEERVVFFVASDAIPYDGELATFIVGHEYVHALQDHDGALARVLASRSTRTFEQELTLWSALEGEATLFEEVLRAFVHDREPRTWLPERFAIRTAGSDEAIVRQRRPLEASFATFPYTYGAHWATAEWLAHGAPVVADVSSLRLSNREFLARRHGWPSTDAQRCVDERSPSSPPEPRIREALGAWLIQAYVRRRTGDPDRARTAAMKSRGDWLAIDSRAHETDYDFTWRTCWDAPGTALEMRALILAQLRETSGARTTVTSDGDQVVATVSSRPTDQRLSR